MISKIVSKIFALAYRENATHLSNRFNFEFWNILVKWRVKYALIKLISVFLYGVALIIVVYFDIIFPMVPKFFFAMLSTVFMLIYISSCSDGNNGIVTEDSVTLRVASEKRSADTVWAEELEGKRLIEKLPHLEKISTSVNVNPHAVSVAYASNALYPFVPDFGSLDTSSISYGVRSVANSFCSSFVSDEPVENYEKLMQEDMFFSLVFFLKDVSEIIGIDEKTDKASSKKNEANEIFFSSYMIGAPFRNESTYEIPVRFFCKKGTLDCAIFISSADEPKISQLKITKINFR